VTLARVDEAAVDAALRDIAAWHLPGGRPLRPEPDEDRGRRLVTRAVHERLIGVLGVAVRSGDMVLGPQAADAALDAHRAALVWSLRIEQELLAVTSCLGPYGVEPVVVKGPAAAHVDAAEPSLRTFADLDLLVEADDLPLAVELLGQRGGTRQAGERRRGFDRRFAKSVTVRFPDGLEVDVHRTLCDGAHGVRIPAARLHGERVPFVVGGVELWCLAPTHRMLHAAYHLALGSPVPRLGSLRDLAGYLVDPSFALADIVAEAQRWRGEAVLRDAVQTTIATVGIEAPAWERWAATVDVSAREARIVARQRREGSAIGRAKLDGLRELQRWSDRGAYAFALAVPSSAHLRSRGLTRRDLVRRR